MNGKKYEMNYLEQTESPSQQIKDAFFNVPDGKMRGILMLSKADLREYLSANGPSNIVQKFSNEELEKIASDNTFFKIVSNEFKLAEDILSISTSERNQAIILNIDKSLVKKLNEEEFSEHNDVRDFLKEALSHAFYIGVINSNHLDSLTSEDNFDIKKTVTAFSKKGILQLARDEAIDAPPEESTEELNSDIEPKEELPALAPIFTPPKQELAKVPEVKEEIVQITEPPINKEAIENLVRSTLANEKKPQKWNFVIKRNDQGFIESIEATAL